MNMKKNIKLLIIRNKNKTIYIDKNINFTITRIENNDNTNYEYNIFFKRND